MKCPHCNTGIHRNFSQPGQFTIGGMLWTTFYQACPECDKGMIELEAKQAGNPTNKVTVPRYTAYPINASARPLPPEVPNPYKKDFDEAVAVLSLSPKASAALSRRNLQAMIHDQAGIKGRDLNAEIETLIASQKLPSHISDGLHAVRVIGNFAAHPIKSTSSGEIVEVEDGEADWNLDVRNHSLTFTSFSPHSPPNERPELIKSSSRQASL
jgi:hypothetical protein